jgi:hypothetical protein
VNITTRFSLGDSVFVISDSRAWKLGDCPTCDKTGKIMVSGEQFVCPKCEGRKEIRNYKRRWYVDRQDIVGQIRVVANRDELTVIEAMLVSSGVGSGGVLDERNLFATRDEATEECDRRNADHGDAPWECEP